MEENQALHSATDQRLAGQLREALIYAGQLAMVDVVSAGVLRRRAVQPGRKFGDGVEILSGLAPGERVALREGKGVRP